MSEKATMVVGPARLVLQRARAWVAQSLVLAVSLAMCLNAGGCSGSKAGEGNIAVTMRFENVRRQPGAGGIDEWAQIARVLSRHSEQPVKPRFSSPRRLDNAELRDVSAVVVVSKFAALDDIRSDLNDLATTRIGGESDWLTTIGLKERKGGQTIDFSLLSADVSYVSGFVTSDVSVVISGHTARGNVVRLFLKPDQPPLAVTANSSGVWSARVSVLPETKYIYGVSEDPAQRTRPKYFRISTSTLKHENITESEFDGRE